MLKEVNDSKIFTPARTYLEHIWAIKNVEVGLEFEGFLKILQELTLECDDLLDVAKEGSNFGVWQERFTFERLKVVLEEVV